MSKGLNRRAFLLTAAASMFANPAVALPSSIPEQSKSDVILKPSLRNVAAIASKFVNLSDNVNENDVILPSHVKSELAEIAAIFRHAFTQAESNRKNVTCFNDHANWQNENINLFIRAAKLAHSFLSNRTEQELNILAEGSSVASIHRINVNNLILSLEGIISAENNVGNSHRDPGIYWNTPFNGVSFD